MIIDQYIKLKYRDQFRSFHGEAFQHWFERIAFALHGDDCFLAIRVTQGDGGLDGLVLKEGRVYQLYAPPSLATDTAMATKINADFEKAVETCGPSLKAWTMVHNSPDGKVGHRSAKALLQIKENNPTVCVEALGIDGLWEHLEKMTNDTLVSLFGEAPRQKINIDISRILKYAPDELIGREDEKQLLSDAWAKAQRDDVLRPHILTFVALGGEGKTALVAKWAADLAYQDWPGCEAVFAWSFYSQGTREQTAASSDLFLKNALTFFGDEEMANSAKSSFDKGRRLAQLVGARRALLILDGVEPLQYAPTAPTPGELKDQGLSALLKGLAAANQGLCVVTTRYAIPDLKAFRQSTAPQVQLTRLSRKQAWRCSSNAAYKAVHEEFNKLVEDVHGHALTLNLLGAYLHEAHAGDIRKRDLVKLEDADAEEQGGHAFRVMDAYARWFEGEGEKGQRALAVLRLLGLFDRPATADCLAALLQAPAIPHLTEPLVGISEAQRNMVFTRLESAKLLTVNRDAATALLSLDAHPLLREYFAQQLRDEHPDAWRAAHRRLYEHLCANTHEGDQPTLDDLQPLYQAVAHGCQAGMPQKACNKVYHDRITAWHGTEFYSAYKLGAIRFRPGRHRLLFRNPMEPSFTCFDRLQPSLAIGLWLPSACALLGRLHEATRTDAGWT